MPSNIAPQKISELSQELQRSESDVKALVGQLEVTRSELDAAVCHFSYACLLVCKHDSLLQLSQLEKCEGDLESERQRHLISVNQSASLETELKLKLEKTANALAVANSDISSLKSKNSVGIACIVGLFA